ncbi:hypothetical protein HAX54_015296, partial [Datura stramonium]|nr:hypothetical protein [Datura stramonium]
HPDSRTVTDKGLKFLKKGTKGTKSSTTKAPPANRFRARIDEGRLALEYPIIDDIIHVLRLGYVFLEPKECSLTLVREFYANWDTSFGESTKFKIWGQVVCFSAW